MGMEDPGGDTRDWVTEWEALAPLVVDSPAEALPEVDSLVEQMMLARGFPVEEEAATQSAEPEVVAEFLEARRITRLADSGQDVDPGDIGAAVTGYRNLYEYLLGDRVDVDDRTAD